MSVGMPVIVTWNVHTELDVANGSRGDIVGIALHPEDVSDQQEESQCVRELTYSVLHSRSPASDENRTATRSSPSRHPNITIDKNLYHHGC